MDFKSAISLTRKVRYLWFTSPSFSHIQTAFTSCSGLQKFTAPNGMIKPCDEGRGYQNNANCSFLINAKIGSVVHLMFEMMDTEEGHDFVLVHAGSHLHKLILTLPFRSTMETAPLLHWSGDTAVFSLLRQSTAQAARSSSCSLRITQRVVLASQLVISMVIIVARSRLVA